MSADFLRHPSVYYAGEALKLTLFAVLGIFIYGLAFQLLVTSGHVSADADGEGYGRALTQQAVFVWGGGILLGLVALFIRANWRWPLMLAPAYGPALYILMVGYLG